MAIIRVREAFGSSRRLQSALGWRENGILTGRESALARVLQTLASDWADDFDQLDASDQRAIVDALAAVAASTEAAQSWAGHD